MSIARVTHAVWCRSGTKPLRPDSCGDLSVACHFPMPEWGSTVGRTAAMQTCPPFVALVTRAGVKDPQQGNDVLIHDASLRCPHSSRSKRCNSVVKTRPDDTSRHMGTGLDVIDDRAPVPMFVYTSTQLGDDASNRQAVSGQLSPCCRVECVTRQGKAVNSLQSPLQFPNSGFCSGESKHLVRP